MQNIGEEIVGAYLQHIKGCEFIQFNLPLLMRQGEIDVLGIDIKEKTLYVCEVAVHVQGLQYVKDRSPDNINRFTAKFRKNAEYAQSRFGNYNARYMLWSPIVRISGKSAKHNQMRDVLQIQKNLRKEGISVELIVNHQFHNCLLELRNIARKETRECKSPVLRLMQIEEYLQKHIAKIPMDCDSS